MASTSLVPVGYRHFKPEIDQVAVSFGLDPLVVAAVCWQESSFRADAYRFEPDFWNRYLKKLPEWAGSNPRRVSASYGLMQLMFPVAVEDGSIHRTDDPETLFAPTIGLNAGCKRLAKLQAWSAKLPLSSDEQQVAMLAAYNGGKGGNDKPPFRNVSYGRQVQGKMGILRREARA